MGFLGGLIIGIFLGCVTGIFIVALFSVNKKDEEEEKNCKTSTLNYYHDIFVDK